MANNPDQLPSLYAITPQWTLDRLVPELQALTETSNVVVQVRDKDLADSEALLRAQAIVDVCQATSTICIINDRPDIAAEVGAHGVHVGASDSSVTEARSHIGDGLVGVTCRNLTQAKQAVREGANYLGVGPVFPTKSKVGLPEPLGQETLAAIVRSVPVPVYAIGGITPERAADAINAGAHGVAAIAALFSADSPAAIQAAKFEHAMTAANPLPT